MMREREWRREGDRRKGEGEGYRTYERMKGKEREKEEGERGTYK